MFWLALLFAGVILVGMFWDELREGWRAIMVEFEGDVD